MGRPKKQTKEKGEEKAKKKKNDIEFRVFFILTLTFNNIKKYFDHFRRVRDLEEPRESAKRTPER